MPDHDELDRRLRAVERALTDDADLTALHDAAELSRAVDSLADRLDEVEQRLDELDAATQALRGYVGNVRDVNDEVERRADAALAAVERLEADLDAADSTDVNDVTAAGDAADTTNPGDAADAREDAGAHAGELTPGGDPAQALDPARDPVRGGTGSSDEQSGVLDRLAATLSGSR